MDDIKVGDRVRSYDFPGIHDNCYLEGPVEQIGSFPEFPGCHRYKIRVDRAVFEGRDYTAKRQAHLNGEPDYVYPPVNGTRRLFGIGGDRCNGVERIPVDGEVMAVQQGVIMTYNAGTGEVEDSGDRL